MATVVSGANVQPMPTPCHDLRGQEVIPGRVDLRDEHDPAHPGGEARTSPLIRMNLPPIRSVMRPAAGATNIAISEAGASVSPALSAEKPSTSWR